MNDYKNLINEMLGVEGYWNGTFYSNNRVYVNNKEYRLTDEQVQQLKDAKAEGEANNEDIKIQKRIARKNLLLDIRDRYILAKSLTGEEDKKIRRALMHGISNEARYIFLLNKLENYVDEVFDLLNELVEEKK